MLLYFISHFNVYVENFTSYVTLYLYVDWCHGLRLPDLNKETTYLFTYKNYSHSYPFPEYCRCAFKRRANWASQYDS